VVGINTPRQPVRIDVVAIDRAVLFRLATSTRLESAVRSVPGGQALAWRAAARYVAGRTVDDAARLVDELSAQGVAASIDQFGESVAELAVARRVGDEYVGLADRVAGMPSDTWLALDLSHLGIDVDPTGCVDRLTAIARALPEGRRVQVGAEDLARTDAILDCLLAVADRGLADRLGATVQANLFRTSEDVERLVAAGLHIRLVKGAYVESRDLAWPYGEPTDVAFIRLARKLADAGAPFALATHDGVLREALLTALGPITVEHLLGVRPEVITDLVERGVPTRIYVPFGRDWFRYWMRRVAESRGA
jgi:proline dehydrogenase